MTCVLVLLSTTVLAAYPPDPSTPARLLAHAAVQPLLKGFVDVTLPPYNAVGDGINDDSVAIQNAVDDCYTGRYTVWLPANKTFLLTRQLRLIQTIRSRSFGFQISGGGGGEHASIGGGARYVRSSMRFFACLLQWTCITTQCC